MGKNIITGTQIIKAVQKEMWYTWDERVYTETVTESEFGINRYKKDITKEYINAVIHCFYDELIKAALTGSEVQIRNFGTFYTTEYHCRKVRNPRTGEWLNLPFKKKIKFKLGTKWQEILNKDR